MYFICWLRHNIIRFYWRKTYLLFVIFGVSLRGRKAASMVVVVLLNRVFSLLELNLDLILLGCHLKYAGVLARNGPRVVLVLVLSCHRRFAWAMLTGQHQFTLGSLLDGVWRLWNHSIVPLFTHSLLFPLKSVRKYCVGGRHVWTVGRIRLVFCEVSRHSTLLL